MSDIRLIGFRPSPSQPLSYAYLSPPDADALSLFVRENVRPDVLTCGTPPTFALAEFLRAAPRGMTPAGRMFLAVEWTRSHGMAVKPWATWTADLLPAESDYLEPCR